MPAVDKASSNGRMDSGQASYVHGGALEACALVAEIDKELAWLRAEEGLVKGYLPLQWGVGACPTN